MGKFLIKKITIYLVLGFACLRSIPLAAQEEFIEPPSRLLTVVPFLQLTGGIIIMQAKLGNLPDTLNFILDTGSSGISLDSITAEYLKLKPVPTERTIRGIAGIHKVSFLYNQQLKFPGLTIDSLDFHINDYSILTAVYGERIDGIIGYSVLNRYIMKVDYDSLNISFWSKGTIRYPRGGYLLKPSINMLVSQPLKVRDDKSINSRFLYDMGAGLCMLLSKDFIEDSVFLTKNKKKWIKEGEGLGGKIDMELTVIREVKLGPYRFRNVPVYIFEDVNNVTSYPYMGGLIGNDILRRFNVILNYAKGDIYITPNRHYTDVFDYSYAGVELYLIEGLIIVGDVAKGSPAETAGVKEGDQVLAINRNFSQNLNQYKIILQSPNEKIKIIIRRNGEIKDIEFKIKSIL
ncbi:MAG: aspartyl protease family protein [Chitinophagaceae bacterium]|nr:aspartyl protease family protein [Chitinophagaceae bacterium]MBK9569914.1 aspartyl protease family protein [Chitinophagaceae bacterium]